MGLSAIFFFFYVFVVGCIGYLSSRKATEEDFMIAGRRVAGSQLAATMSAGFFDGATLGVYLAYIYQFGLSAIWLFIGFGFGFLMLQHFSGVIKAKADAMRVYSMPEYFYRLIGKRSGQMFSVVLVTAFFLFLVVNLIVSGKVLSSIFPISYAFSVAIGGVIILLYLFLAGFKAVVRTDVFQFLIMILMSVSVGLYLLRISPIPATDLNLTALGAGNFVAFFAIGILTAVVSPDLWQRIFASRDQKTLRRGLTYAALLIPLVALIISVMGLATKQFIPDIAPEDALVTGFSTLLPFGFKQLGMVLLYAVSLSSSDTIAFVISSIFTRDLQNYVPRFGEKSMRMLTRIFMVVFIGLAILVSLISQDILTLGFALAGIAIALSPAIIGSFFFRLNDRAVAISLALSMLSIVVLFLFDLLSPETALISLPVALVSLVGLQVFFARKLPLRA